MANQNYKIFTIAETSPAAPGTVASSLLVNGLSGFDLITVDADLVGATGGTLDVYLQRLVGDPATSTTWNDWVHFPQLASGGAAIKYTLGVGMLTPTAITVVGRNLSPALAANNFIQTPPGERVRAVYVAGSGTSAGAALSITLTGWKAPHL